MKRIIKPMAVIFLVAASVSGFSQAGIYMFSPNLPGSITGGIHNGETPITSISRSYENDATIGGPGGAGAGKATNGGLTILKPYNRPSINLKDALWRGTNLVKVEIRFYNNNDQLYYKITLGGINNGPIVLVRSIIESGEVCPSDCPGVTEQIKFNFSHVEERDLLINPPLIRCWDFTQNKQTCAN